MGDTDLSDVARHIAEVYGETLRTLPEIHRLHWIPAIIPQKVTYIFKVRTVTFYFTGLSRLLSIINEKIGYLAASPFAFCLRSSCVR